MNYNTTTQDYSIIYISIYHRTEPFSLAKDCVNDLFTSLKLATAL